MILNDIYKKNNQIDMYVVYAKSGEYLNMVFTMVSSRFHILKDDIYYLENINDILRYKTLIMTVPLFSGKYLFYVENSNSLPKKEVVELLATNDTYKLVVGTKNFGIIGKMRTYESLNRLVRVDYLFSSRLHRDEFDLLYHYATSLEKSTKLDDRLLDKVRKGYLQEVSSVFSLLDYLKDGYIIKTDDDLVNLIGLGNLSVDSIVFSLLTTTAKTFRGVDMFKKKQVPRLKELLIRMSPQTLQEQIHESLKAAYQIKVLSLRGILLPGVVTKSKDINGYGGNNKLGFYEVRKDSIQVLPLTRIANMLTLIDEEDIWNYEYQVIGFIERALAVRTITRQED